jgi:hypothetical protein
VFVSNNEKKLGVNRKKNSSQTATHDSFVRARFVSLDIDRNVSLYHRRTMSANSCACAHSSTASSRTTMR